MEGQTETVWQQRTASGYQESRRGQHRPTTGCDPKAKRKSGERRPTLHYSYNKTARILPDSAYFDRYFIKMLISKETSRD